VKLTDFHRSVNSFFFSVLFFLLERNANVIALCGREGRGMRKRGENLSFFFLDKFFALRPETILDSSAALIGFAFQ